MADALLHIGLHKTGTTAFQQWASHNADTTLLISSEVLPLLRDEHEVRTVCDLLASRQLRVAVCLRSPESWLESYRQQHVRHGYLSEFRSSHAYVGPDTWLTDWDQMLRVWRNVLGDENVVTCDYDDSVARYGSSIPAVLTALGIDPDKVPPWQGFVANVTSGAHRNLRTRGANRHRTHSSCQEPPAAGSAGEPAGLAAAAGGSRAAADPTAPHLTTFTPPGAGGSHRPPPPPGQFRRRR